jgi:hypothetical protein
LELITIMYTIFFITTTSQNHRRSMMHTTPEADVLGTKKRHLPSPNEAQQEAIKKRKIEAQQKLEAKANKNSEEVKRTKEQGVERKNKDDQGKDTNKKTYSYQEADKKQIVDKEQEAQKQQEAGKQQEAQKQRDVDKKQEAQKQQEADKHQEAEKQQDADKQHEVGKQQEADKQQEDDKPREVDKYKIMDKKQEADKKVDKKQQDDKNQEVEKKEADRKQEEDKNQELRKQKKKVEKQQKRDIRKQDKKREFDKKQQANKKQGVEKNQEVEKKQEADKKQGLKNKEAADKDRALEVDMNEDVETEQEVVKNKKKDVQKAEMKKKEKKQESDKEGEKQELENDVKDKNKGVEEKKPEAYKATGELAKIHDQAICALTFEDVGPLVAMIDVMNGILVDCPITIVGPGFKCDLSESTQKKLCKGLSQQEESDEGDNFSGFLFKCLDASHTCLVIAKLAAQVLIDKSVTQGDTRLNVPVSLLSSLLKSVDSSSTVHLYIKHGSPTLNLKAVSSTNSMHYNIMGISTKDFVEQEFDISDLSYDYTLEIDLNTFQKIVRTAKHINSDFLRIRILTEKSKKKNTRSFLVVQSYGSFSSDEHVFCSNTTKDEDSRKTIVIKNADLDIDDGANDPANVSISQLDELYNGLFPLEFLSCFLRNLEQPVVLMRIASEEDKPIILTSFFGMYFSCVLRLC